MFHGTRKKSKKKPPGTIDKSISNHCPGEKEKIIGQKERKDQPRPTPWKKSRDTQSVGQKKTKNLSLLALVGVRLPDDPIRWNFSRRFPSHDLS